MQKYKYQQLAAELKKQIEDQKIPPHTKLDSIRDIAKTSHLSIISVQKALQLLEARGVVYAKQKSGYYVAVQKAFLNGKTQKTLLSPKLVNVPDIFFEIMQQGAAFDIAPQNIASAETPNQLLILHRHISRSLRQHAQSKALYYCEPAGSYALRQQISHHYAHRSIEVSPEDICITSGCQNSLFLALSCFCKQGDIVAVESPAFYGVLQLLQQLKLKVIELPCSYTYGLNANALETAALKWPIKACIVTPNYATPTGAIIPDSEQLAIVNIAIKYNILLIEDDIYGDLSFHSQVAPMKKYDQDDRIILCGSLSKTLSRDLRLGWIMTGNKINKISHLKLVSQLSTSQAIQEGVTSYLSQGYYERHLYHYRQQLLKQREQLIQAIGNLWHFPVHYTVPEGGISLWIELPKKANALSIYHEAQKMGITITPGQLFTTEDKFHSNLRLSFAHPTTGHRLKALKQLGEIILKLL